MLFAVARSAVRQLNAPIATASRNVYTLPIILSNTRSYSAISEALVHSEAVEHSDPSSTATTKKAGRPRRSSAEIAKAEKVKAKAKAQKEKEKERLQAKKLAEKEKLKARKVAGKERAKVKELAEKEKLKAKKLAEKEKLKEKAPQLKEEAELVAAVQHLLAVPKALPRIAVSIYIGEKAKGGPGSALADCAKSWNNEDSSVKAEYEARAEANAAANEAAFEEFIKSHKPIEIYNHNVAVRTLKAKGVSKSVLSNKKLNADKNVTYSEIKDPRVPKRPVPSYIQFCTEKMQERPADESVVDHNKKVTQEWRSLSEEEKKAYSEKQEAYRTDVYNPKIMALFGTISPSRIAYNTRQPKGSAAVAA